ncbi:hypothetical protein D0Z08_00925 [Nocardioides immobilis]|uniref:M23ase beta-sheet core domain-containing protein n=1 Tax=Nocardioides immobilis TaxID=2049295 RepID=A0A417Y8D3_9ACTN|nr:hypothetical protein D0Z08_00925 [Nocardioides immobilis]
MVREFATVRELARSGDPVFLVGDFNDGQDDPRAHCRLRGSMTNAFGAGVAVPCQPPARDRGVDHIFGANTSFVAADVDPAPRLQRLSDHPLVTATVAAVPPATVVPPVPPALVGTDVDNWGDDGGSHWDSWHTGTDFSVPCGTPVRAATSGTVEVDANQPWAGRWLVKVVTGPDSVATWYAHMQTLDVHARQSVRAGQQIGEAGARGNATGCHLHFEVHLHNGSIYGPDNVNPSQWLAQHASRTGAALPAV